MKKVLFVLLALFSLAFTSCFKESQYYIIYRDVADASVNVTLFEYDSSYDLVATREIKLIEHNDTIPVTSSDLAQYVVVGCERAFRGTLLEFYSERSFELSHDTPIYIDVDFVGMATSPENPVNPAHHIQHYFH